MKAGEQLGPPLKLAARRDTLALGAMAVVVAATLAWSLLGTITPRVEASGYVAAADRDYLRIEATHAGQVRMYPIAVGQSVAAGDPLLALNGRRIDSPVDGRILEIAVSSGTTVQPGVELVRLLSDTARPELLALFPLEVARGLRAGMSARVDLDTVGPSSRTSLSATVTQVQSVAASRMYLVSSVGAVSIADAILAKGPVVAVSLKVEGGESIDAVLPIGTPFKATVLLESVRPIQLLMAGSGSARP